MCFLGVLSEGRSGGCTLEKKKGVEVIALQCKRRQEEL